MEKKLTIKEAYNAMQKFLDIYRINTNSDQVASLLKDMNIIEEGKTLNPIMWERWIKCVEEVLNEQPCVHEVPCSTYSKLKI